MKNEFKLYKVENKWLMDTAIKLSNGILLSITVQPSKEEIALWENLIIALGFDDEEPSNELIGE